MGFSRRQFLSTSSGLVAGSVADWNGLLSLSPATAAEARVTPDLVQLDGAMEPLVRLIEQTPSDKCFGMLVEQLQAGVPYRRFLGALFLAGIRNISPQPPGFKFHCVFVIESAHQLSLDAAPHERLLPLFWALDNFKKSQAGVKEGEFRLPKLTGELPSPEKAWTEFQEAMDDWDSPRADRAITSLARSRGAGELSDILWRLGARDYRSIGHKAIFVVNSLRTLRTIGWQHAEPALRSLVYGLNYGGRESRSSYYTFDDQCWLPNVELAAKSINGLPPNWGAKTANVSATTELLSVIRAGQTELACRSVVEQLQSGKVSSGAIWDASHLAAGELMMRMPNIYGVHTVTSLSALHTMFADCPDPELRLLLTLQGVGWMCQFRNMMAHTDRGTLGDVNITELAAAEIPKEAAAASEAIFANVEVDSPMAARQALAYAKQNPEPAEFLRQARHLIFTKATGSHEYKYPAAIFEDLYRVNAEWRPQMLATAVYYLRGSQKPDSPLMQRAVEAVRSV